MTSPEFSRTVRADTIGAQPLAMRIAAEPGERQALARRFGILSLDLLEAELSVARPNEDALAAGRFTAEVVQSCAITGEPVPARIEEDFEIHFRPLPTGGEPEEEVELAEQELDVMFYDAAMVDLGEAVAQTLALALDPYPRAPGAEDALKQAGVIDESEAGPFGALAGLRDKLGK